MSSIKKIVVVIGGGAAGFFAAIACAEHNPNCRVILLEKSVQPLAKVRISGGGRCNVTHACFDPRRLVQHYPRGEKELLGPFHRFQPRDTMEWFSKRGVPLKVENDGRVFPVSNSSESVITALKEAAHAAGAVLRTQASVTGIEKSERGFCILLRGGEVLECERLIIATGSHANTIEHLQALGHSIVPQVPSLFTFNVPTSPLLDLSGIAIGDVQVEITRTPLRERGPLLLTHFGFSGPAALRLSAWGARTLHACNYQAELKLNWLPELSDVYFMERLGLLRTQHGNEPIATSAAFGLPRKLWRRLCLTAGIGEELNWASLTQEATQRLRTALFAQSFRVEGKTTHKEEFVTAGGVKLAEVNFTTMESRIVPGLHFAGEVLDIDGITGGFNFQSAWTTGWIAGRCASGNT